MSGRDNRGRFAVGVSGNPRGRKPVGETAAAAARQKLTPEALATKLLALADGATSEQVRLGALLALAERGYGKTTTPIDINRGDDGDELDLSRFTEDELRAWLALHEKAANSGGSAGDCKNSDSAATPMGQQPDGVPTENEADEPAVPTSRPPEAA